MVNGDDLRLSDGLILSTARTSRLGEGHVRILMPAALPTAGAEPGLQLELRPGAVGIRGEDVPAHRFTVDAEDAAGSVLATVSAAIWRSEPQFRPDERARIAGVISTLAVTWLVPELLAGATGASSVRLAAVLDVWTHLKDPNLSVAAIARRTAVSERALYAAFSDGTERLGAIIRRIRREREAAELESLPPRPDVRRTVGRRWAAPQLPSRK